MMTGNMAAATAERNIDGRDDAARMRAAMVASQLRPNAVDDQRVVAAMAAIPREDFLPAAARGAAYRDTVIPAGRGRWINTPLATGRLLTRAELVPADRVLLIGAATGYAAAVLAGIVAQVVAVEEDPALAEQARVALAATGNVRVVEGPLAAGSAGDAPFDVLILDGAAEVLPDALVAQLRPGGRISAGVVDRGMTRLAFGRRTEHGHGLEPYADYECVPLPGFERRRGFQF